MGGRTFSEIHPYTSKDKNYGRIRTGRRDRFGKFSSTARARSRSGPSKIEKPRSSSDASSPRLRGLASRNRAKRLRTPAAPPIYVSLSYIRYNWQAFQRRVSLHAGINWGEAVVCQQGSKPVEASRNISQTVKRDKRDWQCTPLARTLTRPVYFGGIHGTS